MLERVIRKVSVTGRLDRRAFANSSRQRSDGAATTPKIAGYTWWMGAAAVWAGLEYAEKFFNGIADVQQAMRKLVTALDELEIPYAILGGLALNAYGYRRVTVDVDVLLTRESLQRFKDQRLGRGYEEKFPGSRGFRDTELDVMIDVFMTGDYPGDGQPKPVQFPDPAKVAIREEGLALIPLAKLIELKLASGITSIHRAKDIPDVFELIRHAKLGRELPRRSIRPCAPSISSSGTPRRFLIQCLSDAQLENDATVLLFVVFDTRDHDYSSRRSLNCWIRL